MPRLPAWYREVERIAAEVEALAEPVIDRRTVERIWRVSQTEAGRIIRAIGARRAGNANTVLKRDTAAWLRRVARGDACDREVRRVARVQAVIADAGRSLAARVVPIAPPRSEAFLDLPENIKIGTGRLVITFSDAPDLLRALNELAQAAVRDWPRFQAACDQSRERK